MIKLFGRAERSKQVMDKAGGKSKGRPQIESVVPRAAIPGGEISVRGSGFAEDGRTRPVVRFGKHAGTLVLSSPAD